VADLEKKVVWVGRLKKKEAAKVLTFAASKSLAVTRERRSSS
jgi:hypothetical protein